MNRNEHFNENGTEGPETHSFPTKLTIAFIPILLAVCLTGCNQTPGTPAADASTNDTGAAYMVPTHAQPKLATVKLYLGAETLDAEMAVTPLEEATGLMYRTNITDDTAMLFNLHRPMQASFWMTNCPISISCAYIGPDGVIEEIHHLEKNDNVPVLSSNNNILFVLEVNDGWFPRHNIAPGMLIRSERGTLAETFAQ